MAVLNAIGAALSFWIFGFVGLDVRYSYTMYGAAVAGTVALTCAVAREAPLLRPSPIVMKELLASFYVSLATHRDFYWVFWIRCTYYMGISVLSFMMLFLRDAILPISGDSPIFGAAVPTERRPLFYTSMIAMIGQLGAVAIAVPIGHLSDQHGRKPYIYLSCAMMAGVYVIFLFAPPLTYILAIGFVYGMGQGSFLTVDYALAVDTLPNKEDAAKDLGLWGVSAFVGSSCGPVVLGPLLHVVGILALGGTWDDVIGGSSSSSLEASLAKSNAVDVRYGLAGYQAIMLGGTFFVGLSAALLKNVQRR